MTGQDASPDTRGSACLLPVVTVEFQSSNAWSVDCRGCEERLGEALPADAAVQLRNAHVQEHLQVQGIAQPLGWGTT